MHCVTAIKSVMSILDCTGSRTRVASRDSYRRQTGRHCYRCTTRSTSLVWTWSYTGRSGCGSSKQLREMATRIPLLPCWRDSPTTPTRARPSSTSKPNGVSATTGLLNCVCVLFQVQSRAIQPTGCCAMTTRTPQLNLSPRSATQLPACQTRPQVPRYSLAGRQQLAWPSRSIPAVSQPANQSVLRTLRQ